MQVLRVYATHPCCIRGCRLQGWIRVPAVTGTGLELCKTHAGELVHALGEFLKTTARDRDGQDERG